MMEKTKVKTGNLIFGILMIILASAFTLIVSITPAGDSANLAGRAYRFAEYIISMLERIFPAQYEFAKKAEVFLEHFLYLIRKVTKSENSREARDHAVDYAIRNKNGR
jgi:hypothetical protein